MTQSKTTKRAIKARIYWRRTPKFDRVQRNDLHLHQSTKWGAKHRTAVLPADPESVEAMELQIATALQKNDDVWKNAPVDGYLPDARAVLRSLGLLGGKR